MTFHSKHDVWQSEDLRRCNPVRQLSAEDVIRIAAKHSCKTPPFKVRQPWAMGCIAAAWTRSWREMLGRMIGWAAIQFTASTRVVEVRDRLNPLMRQPAATDHLSGYRRGQEVDSHVEAFV